MVARIECGECDTMAAELKPQDQPSRDGGVDHPTAAQLDGATADGAPDAAPRRGDPIETRAGRRARSQPAPPGRAGKRPQPREPASWPTSAATRRCRWPATCCRCSTTSTARSRPRRRTTKRARCSKASAWCGSSSSACSQQHHCVGDSRGGRRVRPAVSRGDPAAAVGRRARQSCDDGDAGRLPDARPRRAAGAGDCLERAGGMMSVASRGSACGGRSGSRLTAFTES